MHVGAKRMATAGLLVAFSVIMIWLSSTIETSSLFFIAAASFCVGIAVREWGFGFGFAFWAACFLLNLLVSPQKLYCFTFAGMGLYILISEWLYTKIAESKTMKHRMLILWIGKFLCFNLMYIPILLFAPKLLFTGEINGLSAIILLILGQVVLYVYDVAYRYFQAQIWGRLRVRLMQKKG